MFRRKIVCNGGTAMKHYRQKENFIINNHYRETSSIVKYKTDMQEEWERKVKFYMKTYENLFGITKLAEMHDKVIEVQTELEAIQEKRRKVQEEIFTVQKKLQEMQDILHKTSMGDDMYISVVTQVRELLKEQKRLQDVFSLYDQTEREQQTILALGIKNCQDHERTYREKNKYLSLITGVIGGIIGLVGSSINNWRHRKDIKYFATDIADQVVDLKKSVEKLKLVISSNGVLLNASVYDTKQTEDLVSTIKSQHTILDDSIKSLQLLLSGDKITSSNKDNEETYDDLKKVLNEYEKSVDSKLNKYAYINLSLIGSCALFSALSVFYIFKNN